MGSGPRGRGYRGSRCRPPGGPVRLPVAPLASRRGPRHVPLEGAVSPLHGVARAAQLDRALDLRGAGDGGDLARSRSRPPYRAGKNPLFDGFSQPWSSSTSGCASPRSRPSSTTASRSDGGGSWSSPAPGAGTGMAPLGEGDVRQHRRTRSAGHPANRQLASACGCRLPRRRSRPGGSTRRRREVPRWRQ